jgi:hypothetical protein
VFEKNKGNMRFSLPLICSLIFFLHKAEAMGAGMLGINSYTARFSFLTAAMQRHNIPRKLLQLHHANMNTHAFTLSYLLFFIRTTPSH